MKQLSLKHFILRQRVLDLYRYAVRSSRGIPDPAARKETVAWIRSEFERNRNIEDLAIIEDKISIARREIKQILPTAR